MTNQPESPHTEISDQHALEEQVRLQAKHLEIIHRIILLSHNEIEEERLYRSILDLLMEAFGFDGGSIYVRSADGGHASLLFAANLPEDFLFTVQDVVVDVPPYRTVFLERDLFISSFFDQEFPNPWGIRTVFSVPVVSKGYVIGALNVTSRRHAMISTAERDTLVAIGVELGSALQNLETERSLQEARTNLLTFFNSTDDLFFIIDRQGRIVQVNDRVVSRLGIRRMELIGHSILELHVPGRRAEALHILGKLRAGLTARCNVPLLARSGEAIEIETRVVTGTWGGQPVFFEVSREVGEQRRLKHALLDKNEELQSIFDAFPDFLLQLDQDGRILDYRSGNNAGLPATSGDLLGQKLSEVLPPAIASVLEATFRQTRLTGRIQTSEYSLELPKGTQHYEARFVPMSNGAALGLVRNISQRIHAEQSLRSSRAKQRAILDSLPFLAWLKDDEGRYEAVNAPLAASCGRSIEDILGKTDFEIWPPTLAARHREEDLEVMRAGGQKSDEKKIQDLGQEAWFETFKTAIFNDQGEVIGTAGFSRDISARKQLEKAIEEKNRELEELSRRLAEQANQDGLTGLRNHTCVLKELDQEVSRTLRYGSPLSLLMLDLDHFKRINDEYGHQAGDAVLESVAHLIQETLRPVDIAGRYGGEEFLVILPQTSNESASNVAERIRAAIDALTFKTPGISVTVSIGVAGWTGEGAEQLIAKADQRLYQAKREGRNRVVWQNKLE